MPDSFHPRWRRAILLILLGLLLPVQSSLAYARSLAMLTTPKSEPVMALTSVIESPAVMQHHGHLNGQLGHPNGHLKSHHHAHHHSSPDVEAAMTHESSSEHHHVNDTAKPCHSDSSTGNKNHDCAKCCLIGAAAPPPYAVPAQRQVLERSVFITSSDPLSGFIPDGLERPPRTQLA